MFAIYLLGYALGYLLLAIVTTYVVVKVVGKRGATKRTKIIAALVTLFIFWLIPFWDWLPTVIYHKHLCNTEAGMKIYRTVEGVEGFLEGSAWPINIGYRYGYRNDYSGGYIRLRSNPDKSSFKPWIEESASEPPLYGVKYEQTKFDKWNAWKIRYTIYVVKTGEVLATLTDFGATAADPNVSMSEWRKPWISQRSCLAKDQPEHTELYKKMILETLKPARN